MPAREVLAAAKAWVERLTRGHPAVVRVGYFGSYARDDYVPGSDFDVLIEVSSCTTPRQPDRPDPYRPDSFPVGLEIFVYPSDELARMRADGRSFIAAIDREVRWLT